ncbi:hypothetical protein ACIF83_16400 [Streptomyces sp. NPDC085866]|uniref:hypothetical protein n=1 Tax=Streptomyces sp. NPDC085866 TaxID=3365736 RepID=UPI0037D50717
MARSKKRAVVEYSAKNFLLSLAGLCLAGLVVWFGYVQFFTKGLEHLPVTMCENTVERDQVVQVLPQARSAEEASMHQNAGDDFTFYCHVVTSSASSLWGETRVRPVSKADWLESYRGSGGDKRIIRASADGIEAVAQLDPEDGVAAVYVPCAPPAVPSSDASEDYAVITEVSVRTYEDPKATGTALGQTLTDIAYQLTEHAYKLAECKESRDFPAKLPRYKDG